MKKINFENFKSLTRAYTLPMSVFPFLVGYFLYLEHFTKDPFYIIYQFISGGLLVKTIFMLIGLVCAHMFANLFDDYIDVKKQLNKGLSLNEIDFKSKRKAVKILDGTYSMQDVKIVLRNLAIVAVICALYFICHSGPVSIVYILLGALLTLFYPRSSKYGLSELTIGIVFGPLLVNGVYQCLLGQFEIEVFLISVAVGVITSILAITQGIMDYEFDKPSGKKSLCVVLNNKEHTICIIALLIILSCLDIYINYSKNLLYGNLLFIPIALAAFIGGKLVLSLSEYIEIKDVKFIPKWYFGPMENFDKIKEKHFDYYMYRFYLARNLAIFFNLGIIIALTISYISEVYFLPYNTFLIFVH